MNYRWIVIEISLKDRSILDKYKVLSETKFGEDTTRESRMLKIEVPEKEATDFADSLKKNIIYPYYTHLYHENPKNPNLIVVFSGERFLVPKDSIKRVVDYGLAHDVLEQELDIKPKDISEETW